MLAPTARAALEAVLQLFVSSELQEVVRQIYSDAFLYHLPRATSLADYYSTMIDHLLRHGLSSAFFVKLIARRPLKLTQILDTAQACGVTLSREELSVVSSVAGSPSTMMLVRLDLDSPMTKFNEDSARAALSEVLGTRVSRVHIDSIQSGSTIVMLGGDPEVLQFLVSELNRSEAVRQRLASLIRLKRYGIAYGPDETYLEEIHPAPRAPRTPRSGRPEHSTVGAPGRGPVHLLPLSLAFSDASVEVVSDSLYSAVDPTDPENAIIVRLPGEHGHAPNGYQFFITPPPPSGHVVFHVAAFSGNVADSLEPWTTAGGSLWSPTVMLHSGPGTIQVSVVIVAEPQVVEGTTPSPSRVLHTKRRIRIVAGDDLDG